MFTVLARVVDFDDDFDDGLGVLDCLFVEGLVDSTRLKSPGGRDRLVAYARSPEGVSDSNVVWS